MGLLDRFKKDETKEALKKMGQASGKKNTKKDEEASTEKKEKKAEVVIAKRNVKVGNESYKALLQSLISEKAAVAESLGAYTFKVQKDVNKIQIKQAIAAVYKVKPIKVRIMNIEGKNVRFGRKTGKRSDWKKAIVTLAKGQTINIHEGV